MVCKYTPGGGAGSSSGYGANHSAYYTFEVPFEIRERSYKPTEKEGELFNVGPWAMWDPVPYVRFYEFTINFNGNEPELFPGSGKSWRKRFETSWGNPQSIPYDENTIYILGDYKYYPGYGDYISLFDNFQSEFPGKHGTGFKNIHDTFEDEKSAYWKNEILTPTEINSLKKEMREFIEEYYRGWTVTVRAVT